MRAGSLSMGYELLLRTPLSINTHITCRCIHTHSFYDFLTIHIANNDMRMTVTNHCHYLNYLQWAIPQETVCFLDSTNRLVPIHAIYYSHIGLRLRPM